MSNIAVLVSGTGSLLEAIAKEVPVSLVVADRQCRALEIAQSLGIESVLHERTEFSTRFFDYHGYTVSMLDILKKHKVDCIAMAGFMTIFVSPMFKRFNRKILNIHPSLLPDFKGQYAVRDALKAGVPQTGCTVHYATMELDGGPIVAQEAVPVRQGDTVETLHERIKLVERELYPRIIKQEFNV